MEVARYQLFIGPIQSVMEQIQAVLVDIDGTTADCEKRNRGVL
jgi:hypothetical protein